MHSAPSASAHIGSAFHRDRILKCPVLFQGAQVLGQGLHLGRIQFFHLKRRSGREGLVLHDRREAPRKFGPGREAVTRTNPHRRLCPSHFDGPMNNSHLSLGRLGLKARVDEKFGPTDAQCGRRRANSKIASRPELLGHAGAHLATIETQQHLAFLGIGHREFLKIQNGHFAKVGNCFIHKQELEGRFRRRLDNVPSLKRVAFLWKKDFRGPHALALHHNFAGKTHDFGNDRTRGRGVADHRHETQKNAESAHTPIHLDSIVPSPKLKGQVKRIGLFTVIILMIAGMPGAHAEVPSQLEPQFSEAVLAYNGKNYDLAIKLLDQLLLAAPGTSDFLELMALAYKGTNEIQKSAETYLNLIKSKHAAGGSLKDVAPYFFELGVMSYQAKKFDQARDYLKQSIRGDYNAEAAHFFLGAMAMTEKHWETADDHFSLVTESGPADLQAPAWYYRAQLGAALEDSSATTLAYIEARNASQALLKRSDLAPETRTLLQSIFENSQRALAPLDRTQWFGNVALSGGYDTNVLTSPTSTTSTNPTGAASLKGIFNGGIGVATSPLKDWQVVGSYRLGANYHFNRGVSTGDFLTNNLAVYFNRSPFARTAWGIKLDGALHFQNQGVYTRYVLGGQGGPYLKRQVGKASWITAEAFANYQSFAADSVASSTSTRSGLSYTGKIGYLRDQGVGAWNPQAFVNGLYDSTSGTDYRAWGAGAGLADSAYFGKTSLSLTLSFFLTNYFARTSSVRVDRTYAAELVATHKLSDRFTLVGTVSYTLNSSTDDSSYSYTRLLAVTGINYSLF